MRASKRESAEGALMTPGEVYHCLESVLSLPLAKQAVCVRLAAEVTAPVWREWCRQHRAKDHSRELLDLFCRWLDGAASEEEFDQIAKRFFETLPQDLRNEHDPAGGYAGLALLDIALVALDQCGEVHHSVLQTAVCCAAAAFCRTGINAHSANLDRLTARELEFLDRWWGDCCGQFPELADLRKPAEPDTPSDPRGV
jgi:hypothetical protein